MNLIVGAYAVIFYTEPRYTKGLNIWVNPTRESDFTNREIVYQIGVEPDRIDILMDIEGVNFKEAYKRKVEGKYGDIPIHIISK